MRRLTIVMGFLVVTAACGGSTGTSSSTTPATSAQVSTPATGSPQTAATADATPLVSFDGDSCRLSGTTNFELNTLPAFDIVNDSAVDFSLEVFFVEDSGWTLEDVSNIGPVLLDHSQSPDGIRVRTASGPIGPGEARSINVPFTEGGRYAVGCMTLHFELADREAHFADHFVNVP